MAVKSSGRLKSLDRMDKIIELLQYSQGLGVTEVANQLDLAKSTAHSYLATLEDLEYVTNDSGTYRLGLKFFSHGMAIKNSKLPYQIAQPILDSFTNDVSYPVWLVVEEHEHAIFLDCCPLQTEQSLYGRVGKQTPLHIHAAGKSILANLPRQRIQEIIETSGLSKPTPKTITATDELHDELTTIDEQGFALCDGEAVRGVRGVGVPICHQSTVLGSVATFMLESELIGERYQTEVPNQLQSVARQIETKFADHHGGAS